MIARRWGGAADDSDVIVVGAGLAGLASAGFLTRAGRRVVVLERDDGAGGLARSVRRGAYTFDPAVADLPVGVDGELRDGILRHLGVDVPLEPRRRLYRAALPDGPLDVPFGLDAVAEAHAARYPRRRDEIDRFLALCEQLLVDAHHLPLNLSLASLDEAAARFPVFFRYGGATLADVLDEHITAPALRTALAVSWPKAGLPPERLSFATFAQGLALAARGTLHCHGGFGVLVDALAATVDVAFGAAVGAVAVERGSVVGVRLADGSHVSAPSVVATGRIDELVAPGDLPAAYARKLQRLRPSASCSVLIAATDACPGAAAETMFDGGWLAVPTVDDESLAPAGKHIVILCVPGAVDGDSLTARLDSLLPGVVGSLTFSEWWTGTEPAFGWENTPAQTGGRRPALVTPVGGLYLAGHWTQPGHGAYRAILSGMHAARAVLAATGDEDAVPDFRRS
jgi:phytoene dehydrogenase-like protein